MIEQEIVSFATVLVVTIVIAGGVSCLYALGLRLWTKHAALPQGGARTACRAGSIACFAACVVIVLFALWLMIPIFH